MFRRRRPAFLTSASRNARRAHKAILRANRSDQRWMNLYRERQSRIARWNKAFTFIPLNLSRFAAFFAGLMSAMSDTIATLLPSQRTHMNRAGMLGMGKPKRGRRKRKSARTTSKQISDVAYESLEDRKLLAADLSRSQCCSSAIRGVTMWTSITNVDGDASAFTVDYAFGTAGDIIRTKSTRNWYTGFRDRRNSCQWTVELLRMGICLM